MHARLCCCIIDLNGFKRVTHHCNEHVDEDDDGWHVIESKEKHSHGLDDAGRMIAAREHVRVATVALFARVFDLDAVYTDQSEHGPEQTEQRTR